MTGSGASIWDLLERRAAATPAAVFALDNRHRSMTFTELHEAAQRAAAGLWDMGVRSGSVVSWQLPNRVEAAVLTLALSRLGATQNPLIPILGSREVAFITSEAGTGLLVVPGTWRGVDYPALAASVAAGARDALQTLVVDRDLPDGDPARLGPPPAGLNRWYFYTSGTTADPKGAIHTDATLAAGARGFHRALAVTASDRMSMVIPLTHIGGVIHLIASLETGCAMVFAEHFDGDTTTRQLREQGATILPGGLPFVRSFFAFQDRHPDLSPLFPAGRVMIHGGSPKPSRLHFAAKERLGNGGVVSGYGMTECPMLAWCTPDDPDDEIATTEGRPVTGVEVVVVDPTGREVPVGEEGEILVRGPQLMEGYVNPSLDADAFDPVGRFCTGDLGRIDARGYLRITGRLKDVIIRNMENISALELEELLYEHPDVAEVAVIGLPDDRLGEVACAVVVPAHGAPPPTLDDLCAHLLRAGLSKRKLPERLVVVDHLPRNAMQKVLKARLREEVGGTTPSSPSQHSEVREMHL